MHRLRYATRTGALLRVDGAVAGAFDREHDAVRVDLAAGEHAVALDVERRSLPASGLPATPGIRWWLMQALATEKPRQTIEVEPATVAASDAPHDGHALAVVGHAHLDVAWLWTYAEARRKAARTFATAVNLLEGHDAYVFTQSQPQLYQWVREDEPALFERVHALVKSQRFDASVAAMWVEPDCTVPSGESLLRQLVMGIRYAERELGVTPTVAWLPDSFGFARTLPTLLQHAGIEFFATTKLRWNDTTQFPYTQFVWEGPDGSRVVSALLAAYEGDVTSQRVRLAEERHEPLIVGYSDGGGGPTDAIVDAGTQRGRWSTLGGWFDDLRKGAADLPVVRDELYLEYHRGVFTTHHDIKARNAALERSLGRAELALAWMSVLHASPFFIDEARRNLGQAWEIVLRNQFHDVLPGTSIAPVYVDAHAEYDYADELVRRIIDAGITTLPRFSGPSVPVLSPPTRDGDAFAFDNGLVRARVRDDGTVTLLATNAGPNVVHAANVLSAYHDRPAKWEAWNIDLGYERAPIAIEPLGCEETDDALFVRYRVGGSFGAARISLGEHEPFLRVDQIVEWRERKTLLRCENRLALADARAVFGAPHGVVERTANPKTPAERAKFEASGQRFGRVDGTVDGDAAGFALLSRDTYGWSVTTQADGVHLGHSLLRGTTWPDPGADLGEHHLSYALMPLGRATHSEIETAWRRFVAEDAMPELFTPQDAGIIVVATEPADDGDGLIVRLRECDGVARDVAIAVATRASNVEAVDALERRLATQDAALVEGRIVAPFGAFALRTFRVRF